MVLNWFVESEEVFMLQMVSPLILKLSLFLVTAVATHLVMSFGQTFLHYKVAHNPIGGKLFRNHINFHHTHYAEDHLVSRTYLGDEGNITPYFLIPVFLVGGCVYFLLPLNLFVVTVIASAASFYAHVVMGAHNRRLCFPSSFTVLACGPLSPISSANATCVPTARRLNAPSSTLFR